MENVVIIYETIGNDIFEIPEVDPRILELMNEQLKEGE